MKQLSLVILCFLTTALAFAQQQRHRIDFEAEPLERVLVKIEQLFEVKYSYLDSVVRPHSLTLAPSEYSLSQLHLAIQKQCQLDVVAIDRHFYSVFAQDDRVPSFALREIIVSGFVANGIDKTANFVTFKPQQVEILPGVTDADVLRSLQQLPGVKSPNETASGLHVRGGTPDQNLILWDGIRIFHPGHLFGMIAPFNPNIEQTVHYYNQATEVRFGHSVSSIVSIVTNDKIKDSAQVNAGVNLLNADASVQVPLYKKQLGLQVAARKSITEWWRSPTFNALADKVFEHSGFQNFDADDSFGFEDYAAKLNYNPTVNTNFALSAILIDNAIEYQTRPTTQFYSKQTLDIRNYGYSFTWSQKYSSRLKQQLLWHFSDYDFDYARQRNFSAFDFEAYRKRNRIVDSGIKLCFDYRLTPNLQLEWGYEGLGNDASHEITAVNEGFYFNLENQHFFNLTHSIFAQANYRWKLWDLRAGIRYNQFVKLDENRFEPRLLLQRKLNKRFIWQISFEAKSQQVAQFREGVANDLSLENYVWIGSDQINFPLQFASQYNSGLLYKSNGWLVNGEFYYKTCNGITARSFGLLQAFENNSKPGNGYTKGFDFLLQHQFITGRIWATYTYQDSQNRYEGINANHYFASSSNLTHAWSISALKKWKQFSITAGWFLHSGKPFSRLDANGQVNSYNAETLPDCHRLDLSGQYAFSCGKIGKGNAGFSIINLYNKKVVISREYEKQYGSANEILNNSAYTVKDYRSLGFTPNLFFRLML